MKQKHKMAYVNTITTVICAVVIFAGIIGSFVRIQEVDVRHYDNQTRILLSDIVRTIEKGEYPVCEFPYMILGTDGEVRYADTEFHQTNGVFLNVQEMIQSDESFARQHEGLYKEVYVLYREKETITSQTEEDTVTNAGSEITGFVIFLIPEMYLLKEPVYEQILNSLIPLGIAVLFVLLVQIVKTIMYNRKVFHPLREINKSAKHIIAGNYDYEVLRVNGTRVRNDEIGDLVYSFELMRDELKDKQVREEQLKKSQQELISCISHDLKTPISTIKAYGEGLRDGIAQTQEARREYEEVIIRKTNLLNQMITELLEYSNAQLNQLEIKPREVYFLSYFTEVACELKGYAGQRNVEVYYEANLADRIVTIDCKRITQVLYNLVENSIKYMGDQPGRIAITATGIDQEVLICVADNGIGINADDIPYVFDKFYRAEKSRTSSIPGSGLGLSICKYIIEALGGTIYCKSKNGQGCEIGFTLH